MKLTELYLEELETWRARREANLRQEYGWLSLSGLHWLKQGANSFGSAADNDIVLSYYVPPNLGDIVLEDGQVHVHFRDQAPFPLPPLGAGKPEYLFVGDLRLAVIERSGELAIRVWDPLSPTRAAFTGCAWYEAQADARVSARIVPIDPPKPILIEEVHGRQRPGLVNARLEFEYRGQALSLEAERAEDGILNPIFKDQTAGESTYPAGRFLLTEPAEKDQVLLDFNRAYSPPCAFTEFATCPLPQPENVLAVAIEAGEKYKG